MPPAPPPGRVGDPRARVTWCPHPGSQVLALSCPVFECLVEGNRGGGKTDVLLMDFAQDVGRGWGQAWRGVLFRQTHPQLADVISKSKAWFPALFRGCKYNEGDSVWTFAKGEQLRLRHMRVPDDYWDYHGHEYPWIGWEELTNWADDVCYKRMMSCSRSVVPGMPRRYRATTNPYGPGHNWVKLRWRLPGMRGRIIETPGEEDRVAVNARLDENRALMTVDPGYLRRITQAARNPQELAAWTEGNWDIVAGGMFDDLWDPRAHLVEPFRIPRSWRVDRAMDWGSSRPFSVGWYARSDGTDADLGDGRRRPTLPGDLFRVGEWYGWTGRANEGLRMDAREVAQGIREREVALGLGGRVQPGPADSAIFDAEPGKSSVAQDMAAAGVRWERADKSAGSRKNGWEAVRALLLGARPPAGGAPRERPGLFAFGGARSAQLVRTLPSLPRSDEDPDDVDTLAEDHLGDEVRYRCRRRGGGVGQRSF